MINFIRYSFLLRLWVSYYIKQKRNECALGQQNTGFGCFGSNTAIIPLSFCRSYNIYLDIKPPSEDFPD